MSNDARKVSNLNISTTLSSNDRVVVLTNPSSFAQTQTISLSNFAYSLTQNNIPIANSSQLGIIKIGNTLSIAANGVVDISISSFGEGFSLTASDKIVTNELYSTNVSNTTQHYRLTLDTNGVVHLPDESIINGATLKTVPGNYAGITAGPVGKDEDSWVWVDNDGTWIATDYSNNAFTWHFNNNGTLTLPTGGHIDTVSGTGGFKLTTDGQIQFASGYSIGGSDTGLGLRMATDRGTILFGNHPEPGTVTHFHIMKQDPSHVDLFLGDDFNYVKLKGNENIAPSQPYGVEIGANDGDQHVWRFGTDGKTTFPSSPAPVHSYGAIGDKAGMISFDVSYIYYCTADYVDDVTNIWKRIAWPGDTW
jgi:hypothetical protein